MQVGLVVRDVLALGLAAREAARAVAVEGTDEAAAAAVARSAGPLDAGLIEMTLRPPPGERRRGQPVTVELAYIERLRVPVVERMAFSELVLHSSATMRLERAPPSASPSAPPPPSPSPDVPPPSQTPPTAGP